MCKVFLKNNVIVGSGSGEIVECNSEYDDFVSFENENAMQTFIKARN